MVGEQTTKQTTEKEAMEATHDDPQVEDDEEEEEDMMGESGVQLGFVEKTSNALFADTDWRNWDGGKVGGAPVRNLPCLELLITALNVMFMDLHIRFG